MLEPVLEPVVEQVVEPVVEPAPVVAVIGDVVGSRTAPDRNLLQATLRDALADGSPEGALQPLTPTVGDEFQGMFATVDEALAITAEVRLRLCGEVDVRFGIGVGHVATLDGGQGPFGQDGPGWWRAREALELAEERARAYGWPPTLRTVFVSGSAADEAVNAYLVLRDHLIGSLDAVDATIVRGLAAGETQSALAGRLGLDKSSVSRRVSQHGLSALLRAQASFDEVLG